MKRILAAAVAALSLTALAGGLKIGTVDMMLLVRNHPSYESNKELLKSTEKDYQKELDAMQSTLQDIQDEGKSVADELKNPMLSEAAKKASEKKIMDIQQRFVRQQQELRKKAMDNQEALSKLEARLLKSQAEDLKKRIARFAEREDYDLVMESAAALWAKSDLDVTDEILTDMNVDPKAARAKDKDEGK